MSHTTPDDILRLGMGFWASQTLLSADEYGGVHGTSLVSSKLGSASGSSASMKDRLATFSTPRWPQGAAQASGGLPQHAPRRID